MKNWCLLTVIMKSIWWNGTIICTHAQHNETTVLFNKAHAFTKPNNPQTNLWGTIFPRPINSIWHLITRRVDGNLFTLRRWFLRLITKYFWGDEAHFAGRTFPRRFSCSSSLLISLYSRLIIFNDHNHRLHFCVPITKWNWSAVFSPKHFLWSTRQLLKWSQYCKNVLRHLHRNSTSNGPNIKKKSLVIFFLVTKFGCNFNCLPFLY